MTRNELQKRVIKALATAPQTALEKLAEEKDLSTEERALVRRIAAILDPKR